MDSIQLGKFHINIDLSNIDEYRDLCYNIEFTHNQSYDELIDLFKSYFETSNINEHCNINKEDITKISHYLEQCQCNNKIPIIKELYSYIYPNKPCFRDPDDEYGGFVGVHKGYRKNI